MDADVLAGEEAERLVSACRATIGDELRSVVYFTPGAVEQVYLRSDLEPAADLEAFAANERLGFGSQVTYGDTELGEYRFTIRAFAHGYLTRVVSGERGVFVTTDRLSMERFEELAAAAAGVLRGM